MKTRGFLLAVAVATMAFTFSCSSDDKEDNGGGGQSSPSGDLSSSDGGGGSSSSVGNGGESSSSVTAQESSSSLGGGESSSSVTAQESSSSSDGVELSSSSNSVGDNSSSSNGGNQTLYCDYGPITQYGGGCLLIANKDDCATEWGSLIENGGVCGDERTPIRGCPDPSVSDNSMSCGGQTYKTVTIGSQVWMAENLNYNLGSDNSRCYDGAPTNCNIYGRLYSWVPAQNVCPAGWHLPSDAEWTALTDYIGSNPGAKLKAESGWDEEGNGTDNYGFSALPGGRRISSEGSSENVGRIGYWWSATENSGGSVSYRYMDYERNLVYKNNYSKSVMLSVRCVQNSLED